MTQDRITVQLYPIKSQLANNVMNQAQVSKVSK